METNPHNKFWKEKVRSLFILVYQHLSLKIENKHIEEEYFYSKNYNEKIFDLYKLIVEKETKQENIKIIEKHLRNWTFDRLPISDQTILLISCYFLKKKTISHKIIIKEAILFSQQYNPKKDSYKYINAILNNIKKWKIIIKQFLFIV